MNRLSGEKIARKGGGERACRQTFEAAILPSLIICQSVSCVGKLVGNEWCFAPSENSVKWNTSLIVDFAKSC